MVLRTLVIDVDGHVYEINDVLTVYYETPHAITKRNQLLTKLQALGS